MEDWAKGPRELHTGLFRRVEREAKVTDYLVYWPLGGHLHGLDWELNHLTELVMDEKLRARAVHHFPESGVVERSPLTLKHQFVEGRNRTRYYEDLVALGCPVRVWENYDELRFALEQISWS